MSKTDCPLVPVHAQDGCRGHLLRSRHHWAAFDADDKLVGIYETTSAGAEALLAIIPAQRRTNRK